MPRRGKQNDMDLVDAVCNALHFDDTMRQQFHTYLHDQYGDSTQGMKFQQMKDIGIEFKDVYYSKLREDRQRARDGASGASRENKRRSRRDHTPGEFQGPLY